MPHLDGSDEPLTIVNDGEAKRKDGRCVVHTLFTWAQRARNRRSAP